MSQFICLIKGGDATGDLFALDDEGIIWKGGLDGECQPFFIEYYRSVTEPKPARAKKEKEPKQSFEEWFAGMQANPTYAYINWPVELEKMKDWFKRNPDRRMTERFVMRWLNKIEAPIPLESLSANVCQRRVRKEGRSFMQPCGKPATEKYQASPMAGIRCCKDCYDELMGGRK